MISFPWVAWSWIDCWASTTLNATSFTILAWVSRAWAGVTASTGSGGLTAVEPIFHRLVWEADWSNLDGNYSLGFVPASLKFAADFEDLNTGLNHPFTFTTAQSSTGIYCVAVTYDWWASNPWNWAGYVNGVADGTKTESSATLNVRTPRNDSIQKVGIWVAINSAGTRTGWWNGNIMEIAFWKNRVLSGAEIAMINGARQKWFCRQFYPADLKGYWQLNETSDGTTVSTSAWAIKDISWNGNNGTAFWTLTGRAENYLSY